MSTHERPDGTTPGPRPGQRAASSLAACPGQDQGDALAFDNAVGLTEREHEIVRLIATGVTNEQVARTLFVSVNTVKSYVRTAYRKMGVQTRSQAVVWAFDHGLATPRLTAVAETLRQLSVGVARDAG